MTDNTRTELVNLYRRVNHGRMVTHGDYQLNDGTPLTEHEVTQVESMTWAERDAALNTAERPIVNCVHAQQTDTTLHYAIRGRGITLCGISPGPEAEPAEPTFTIGCEPCKAAKGDLSRQHGGLLMSGHECQVNNCNLCRPAEPDGSTT